MALVADGEALIGESRRLRNAGKLEAAESECRIALAQRGDDPDAHRMLGTILHERGSYDAALASFEEALRLDPGNAKTYKQLAEVLAEHGRVDDALAAGRRALDVRPDYAGALANIASLKRFESADDADLVLIEQLVDGPSRLRDSDRMILLFALGKAYDDLGDFDRSFACLREANAMKRATLDYDVADDERFFERVASVFDADLLARFAGAGAPSEVPVLIIGMPRSGTTLVEQILASHPAVHGGGERPELPEITAVVSVLGADGLGFPEGMAATPRNDLRRLGEGYSHRLHALAPSASRVTDKGLLNFAFLGFAHLVVPRARVIHCVRDPLDTCVSCFGLNFRVMPYGYDLSELGRYYRAYARLMAHWRSVLPPGWILDVRYEDLVGDLEQGARRLVDHCGLAWSEDCLHFEKTERVVRTASCMQVRRPVYRSSVGRWRRYEGHLGPLIEALELDAAGARDAG